MSRPRRTLVALTLLAALASGCTAGPPPAPEGGHAHVGHGAGHASLPVGDGTTTSEVGYTLQDVTLPERAGEPGTLSFVIERFDGRTQTRFLPEQTKRMHVYVVREDLAVYRHVHPEMSADGTWSTQLTLPTPGDYRVVTEFLARDPGGNGDHLLLGDSVTVPGDWSARAVPAADGTAKDWGVRAEVLSDLTAGTGQAMIVRITRRDGGTPALGSYLGTSAHLTGFHVDSRAAVHMHPLGAPTVEDGAAELEFHAELPEPGRYVLFLQVRVDDFLHTLPVQVDAA